MECNEIQQLIWSDGPDSFELAHIAACADCAGEVARARDLSTALSGLQSSIADAPPELLGSIYAALPRSPLDRARGIVEHPRFWRGAAVGAAATAAAVVGVLVARRRMRPSLAA